MQSVQIAEVPWAGPESEEVIDTSGRSRCKRAPRDVGTLTGCLCGHVVNLDFALDRPTINLDAKLDGYVECCWDRQSKAVV